MVYTCPLKGRNIQSEPKAKSSNTVSTTVIKRSGYVDISGDFWLLSEILSQTNMENS